MHVIQISIFLENKVGRLAEVTKTLFHAGINIKALALADTSDFGILRLIVAAPEKAQSVLKEAGFTVGTTDVVAVEVPHTPGGLHAIVDMMGLAGVNIEYMYGFPYKSDNAVMIFRFDNLEKALAAFKDSDFHILGSDEVYS